MSAALHTASLETLELGALFAADVLAVAAPIDSGAGALWPAERELVANAVPRRVQEFAAGRRLARALLARLGAGDGPLLREPDRSPRWPAGVVGSITHGAGLCAVAVARRGAVAGLGIDVEPAAALEPALWPRIATPRERERWRGAEGGRRARLVFSAKEAFYKSVSRHVGRVLGFHEVEIELDAARGRFAAHFGSDVRARLPEGAVLSGAFVMRGSWLLTGATLRVAAAEDQEEETT